jgi:hypothetical protein
VIYLPIGLLVSGLTSGTKLVIPHRNTRANIPRCPLVLVNPLNPIQIHPSHNPKPFSTRPLQSPHPPLLAIRQAEKHLAFPPVLRTDGDSVCPASACWCLPAMEDRVFLDSLARWDGRCSGDVARPKIEGDRDEVALLGGFEASGRGEENVADR